MTSDGTSKIAVPRQRVGTVERATYPILAKSKRGLAVPWVAAMELEGRVPRHPVLGTETSDYPPDAAAMIEWLLSGDGKSTNLLCNILMAIQQKRIWSDPTFIEGGKVFDPFKYSIRMSEARKVQREGKRRGKKEAEWLLNALIGGSINYGNKFNNRALLRRQGRPSSQLEIIEACKKFAVSGMSASKAYVEVLNGNFPGFKGDPPDGWSSRSFKRAYSIFLGQNS